MNHEDTLHKLKESKDFYLDCSLNHHESYMLYNLLFRLAEQIKPKESIGGCAGGDTRYVYDAMLLNLARELDNGK